MTVVENVMIGAFQKTRDPGRARQRALQALDAVGLADRAEAHARGLSTGQRKRLELARALATQPKLLLLDEVLAGLNPQEITEVIPVIRGIRDTGVTILMIEHVMQAVMNLADDVYVLNNGRLIAHGPPAQVTDDPVVIEAYLGAGTAERLRRMAGAAHA
jgi:branched-chain amino acid transport system ATP-binding protein